MVDARDGDTPTEVNGKPKSSISKAQGNALADELGAVKYLECSAKFAQMGLKSVFDEAIKVVLEPPSNTDIKSKRFCVVL